MHMRFIPVALLLAGCAPQSATLLSGEYFAFLSDTTSFSLAKGTVDPEDWPAKDMWTVDCRAFESKADREAQQLPGALDICDTWLDIDDDEVGDYPPDETWMGQTPWWILHENLDPWRGEAIITSEGDFQVGFHHTLPGGEDFRFAFVIDPDFAPKQCDYETGKAVERDGNWLENWSKDLKGMKQSSCSLNL